MTQLEYRETEDTDYPFNCSSKLKAVLLSDSLTVESLDDYRDASEGGDPAAGSPTATLLRLHPTQQPHLR